jgi:glycosyltransferase involved in cell wall biosynthesis
MKILHVNDRYDEQGGAQQYIFSVARLLGENGHTNAILHRHQTPHPLQGGSWSVYRSEADDADAVTRTVRRVIAQERPDVAFIHHVHSPVLVETIAQMLPAVAYVHGFQAVCPGLCKYHRRGDQVCKRAFGWGCVPMHYLRRCSAARHPVTLARLMQRTARLRRAYLRVQHTLVSTPYMKALFVQNGFAADRITTLPPHFLSPADVPYYQPPEQPDLILYAGRLEIEKGIPYLLRALHQLPERVHLEIAGDGTLRAGYERMAESLGLTNRVQFLGWLDADHLTRCHQRCALMIMPSIYPEGFGKTGIDALAQGRAVVAFAVGGIPDWLDDGEIGLLARPADSEDLARKIGQLLEDWPRQERMGRQGQRIVTERYAPERHLRTLESVLYAVCNS